jgi:hypothetical protein
MGEREVMLWLRSFQCLSVEVVILRPASSQTVNLIISPLPESKLGLQPMDIVSFHVLGKW